MTNVTDIMYKKLIELNGTVGRIDNIECKFLLNECSDLNNNGMDLTTIISDNKNIKQGSLIEINGDYYLVVDMENKFNKTLYNKFIIRKAVKCWYGNNIDSTPTSKDSIEFYGIVEIENSTIDSSNGMISYLTDKYNLICRDIDGIDLNDIFMYKNYKYKVISINNTVEGLKNIKLQISSTYEDELDEYSITCDDISIDMGSNVQLSSVCMKNGVQESNPTITYISLDSSIATCSENGLVEGINKGITTITMEWQGISKTINVSVDTVTLNYEISGSTNLIKDKQTTYTISPSLPSNYSWELDELSIEVELAEIVNSNESQCVLTTTCGDGESVTLSAKANGVVVASIELTCMRK